MPTLLITLSVLLLNLTLSPSAIAAEASEHRYHHDNVLGTSLQLTLHAPKTDADITEQAVLNEIKRLENIFSTYDKNSEISQLNNDKSSVTTRPSKELLAVIALCEQWRAKTPKAFSCRLGNVIQVWQKAFKQQSRPNRKAIRAIARQAANSQYTLQDLTVGKRNQDFKWDFGAIAKGYILDQVLKTAKQTSPNATAIGIDIGGDGIYWQHSSNRQPWQISLANPDNLDDSHNNTIGHLQLSNGAVAYSGHSSRARKIGRRHYSHILTPRDGWPREFPINAIVKAKTATEADAAATSLAAMDISDALDWANTQPDMAALLIGNDGRRYASDSWYQHFSESKTQPSTLNATLNATIRFALPKPKTGQYRKPYVALWLENHERKVVKNFLLLGDSEQWMSENTLWWRRQGRKETHLLQGFARPTRRPGEYQVSWQGRDDYGKTLAAGRYTLTIEVAREHGDHEKISMPFEWGTRQSVLTKRGKKEIQFLTVELMPN